MARPKKPIGLCKVNNWKKSNEEINFRKSNERKLNIEEMFKETKEVKDNKVAHKEFLRLRRLYKQIELIEINGFDESILNRYCLEFAKMKELQLEIKEVLDDLKNENSFSEKTELLKRFDKLDRSSHKLTELLFKYEDRLFLNPFSRIKAIPIKPPKEDKKDKNAYLFGDG